VVWAGFVTDESEVILVTYQGQAIRFRVWTAPTGMGAGGMRAIKLQGKRDRVVGAGVSDERAQRVGVHTIPAWRRAPRSVNTRFRGAAARAWITMKMPKRCGWPDGCDGRASG